MCPLSRCDKGVVLRYLERMTGLSWQQVTRLVRRYLQSGKVVKKRNSPKSGLSPRFDVTDVALLAEMDALHGTMLGSATKKRMERARVVFGETTSPSTKLANNAAQVAGYGDARFDRMVGISVSTCITCGARNNTRTSDSAGPRRGHLASPSASAVPHSRMVCRAISE